MATRAVISLVLASAVGGGLLSGLTPAGAAPQREAVTRLAGPAALKAGRYIVLLRQPSATRYDGGVARLAPTRARGDAAFNGRTAAVRSYTEHLRETHRRIAREIGATVVHDYALAVNGFAARLSGPQAAALSRDRRVLLLEPDLPRQPQTWASPEFLGLTGRNGAWARTGGKATAGAGTVVGVLDTGIWPESKSFSGRALTVTPRTKWDIHRIGEDTFMDKADGTRFHGACQTGEGFAADDCNTKLIGARFYSDIYESMPEEQRSPAEYLSARDGEGHGTHVASIAAGNSGVRARVKGVDFGTISGMAPAARIAAYKVCFSDTDPDTGDCLPTAALKAVDDAIADGVDVLNYSIAGAADTTIDAVGLALEGAAEAGIFVTTAAGNSGPDAASVVHPSPWVTTVAASTHTVFENTVVLGDGTKVVGASLADEPVPWTPLLDSKDAAAPGVAVSEAEMCDVGTLDPRVVAGKVVVCTRGVIGRLTKSAEVARAGGTAMILANPADLSVEPEFHSVPTVHVDHAGATKVWSYLDAEGEDATASFRLGNRTDQITAVPQIAEWSLRGPSAANNGDILKPDISAPGERVLGAVAPPTSSGRRFDLYSGTSMAAPHIAGLAAFLAGERPRWTPMQLKSAMMTTARSLVNANGRPTRDAFAQGAGNVRPRRFLDPGLFVTSTHLQWRGLLAYEGLETGIVTPVRPVAPKDVNQPSMAQGEVTSTASFTRQFTSTMKGTWEVSVRLPGFSVTSSRNKIVSSRRGDVEDLRLDFTRTDAPLGRYAKGFVRLSGPTTVRLPVALRPVTVSAPSEVSGTGVAGSVEVPVTAGFTGDLDIDVHGLDRADTHNGTVAVGAQQTYCVTTTSATEALRVELDAANDAADLDLYAYVLEGDCASPAVATLASSATGAADEGFTVDEPAEGSYLLQVDGFAAAPGEAGIEYLLDVYDVNEGTPEGGLHAEPNPVPVVAGQRSSFDTVWSGLAAGARYFGVLEYEGAEPPTYVSVDTTGAG